MSTGLRSGADRHASAIRRPPTSGPRRRSLGTVLGVVAAGSVLLLQPPVAVAALGMCLVGYLLPTGQARSFLLGTALRTAYALLLIEAANPGVFSLSLLGERILDTVLGAAIAVLASLLLWPFAATRRVPPAVAACLHSIAGLLRDVPQGTSTRPNGTASSWTC